MNATAMNEAITEQLEIKIAYLERANIDLSDVVFRQQLEIRALQVQLQALIERVQAVQPDDRPLDPQAERPPHY